MPTLLERSRALHALLEMEGDAIEFPHIADVLADVLRAQVAILSRKGKLLASAGDERIREALAIQEDNHVPSTIGRELALQPGTVANVRQGQRELGSIVLPGGMLFTAVPIRNKLGWSGTLALLAEEPLDEADLVLAETGAAIIGLAMLRSKSERASEDARRQAAVRLALDTLSYSESAALGYLLEELDGLEGLVVASKVADRVGITRSVIVNALRKLVSAGVIEARSLGMKGTHIRILNPLLLEEFGRAG